jgi:predicted O-linked N-acetylglucosamine transferase (SPINDLY family)
MIWDSKIQEALQNKRYEFVISFYEEKIDHLNSEIRDYCALGVAHLLDGDEITAQLIWSVGLSEIASESLENSLIHFIELLKQEASRQQQIDNAEIAHSIRTYLYELDREDLNNLLELIQLKIDLGWLNSRIINEFELLEKFRNLSISKIDPNILSRFILSILDFPGADAVEIFKSSAEFILSRPDTIKRIKHILDKYTYQKRVLFYSEAIAETSLIYRPDDIYFLKTLRYIKSELKNFNGAFEISKLLHKKSQSLVEKAITSGLMLSAVLESGDWNNSAEILTQYQKDIFNIQNSQHIPKPNFTQSLISQSGLFLYCIDDIKLNRSRHNALGKLLEQSIAEHTTQIFQKQPAKVNDKGHRKLRIGYIGHTFRAHSVGWLCRWLFQKHNREKFDIFIYFVNKNQSLQNCSNPFFQSWFAPYINGARELGKDPVEIASFIQQDKIDILIDLDSTTLGLTCHVLALKPAPIQATWLGRDAAGLSAVDYFIADPYVLPDCAEQHYQEKIWRLPNNYLAIEGFEIGIPTINRKQLDIPEDAVIYLSAQTGLKRHPDLIRLQMKILRQVPNSFFLIKGIADQNTIQELFTQIAEEEGASPQQLRFLTRDSDEYTHRANLQIADIILDTYPYNGATTTLEALWVGIPMVTRVGEQFAARNSYTFMKNAGIEEGIAWSDANYVEWGIRLGEDPWLRQQISWRLKQSRQTAPLWNSAQFTREIEDAYQEMWLNHLNSLR